MLNLNEKIFAAPTVAKPGQFRAASPSLPGGGDMGGTLAEGCIEQGV